MAFVEPITIKAAIEGVHRKQYLLPAIQREFVWDTYQIEKLFDSLMRDYPISSFLFWEVEKNNISSYQFYEFVREYHERDNTHNPKANIGGETGITAVLDGQQRLTSLYIGLKGFIGRKGLNGVNGLIDPDGDAFSNHATGFPSLSNIDPSCNGPSQLRLVAEKKLSSEKNAIHVRLRSNIFSPSNQPTSVVFLSKMGVIVPSFVS